MGGSGGFFRDPSKLAGLCRTIREDEENSVKNSAYEVSANQILASELAAYNNRDTEKIQSILDGVIKSLKNEIDRAVDVIWGGSIAKHTYVDGLSDVDALLIIDPKGVIPSPRELKDNLAKILEKHYKKDAIRIGTLAITLKTDDVELQLLPAMKHKDGYKISDVSGDDWAKINPETFSQKLTKSNQSFNGKVVPVIKLVKAIVSNLPRQQQISGYHTESLAIKIFESYTGSQTLKNMLQYFFEKAPNEVKTPIKDTTGQSIHVDEYLGEENSLNRRIVSMAFDGINRKLKNADGCKSIEIWEMLLGDTAK